MSLDYEAGRDAADSLEDLFITNRMVSYQNTLELLFTKVLEIFEYTNLPETLPKRRLESHLTRNGFAIVYEVDGELFVSDVAPSGKPDVYGDNREVHIPHFEKNEVRTIGVDAVMVRNDSNKIGLETLLSEFALLTAQAKINFLNGLVMLRTNYLLQAKDENAALSALEFEAQVRAGRSSILFAEEMDDFAGIMVHNTPTSGTPVAQAIQLINFIQSYYYSELGITLNNNLKSQYQSEDELQKSTGIPLIFNMLAERLLSVRDINALFDRDIEVCLSSEWQKEIEETPEEEENVDVVEPEVEEDEAPAEEVPEEESDESEIEEGDEPDPVTRDELIEATEILLDEEVPHADEPETPGSDEDHTDDDEDEA